MASISSSALSLSSSSSLFDAKAPRRSTSAPPRFAPQNRPLRAVVHYGKLSRNVTVMATGEAQAETATVDVPEIVKTAQESWDKVDDKYAVSSLAVAALVALWVSAGMISAIDRLPLIPGLLELVGIGYSGWFVYKNLIFQPDREALIEKIKAAYKEVIGSS